MWTMRTILFNCMRTFSDCVSLWEIWVYLCWNFIFLCICILHIDWTTDTQRICNERSFFEPIIPNFKADWALLYKYFVTKMTKKHSNTHTHDSFNDKQWTMTSVFIFDWLLLFVFLIFVFNLERWQLKHQL